MPPQRVRLFRKHFGGGRTSVARFYNWLKDPLEAAKKRFTTRQATSTDWVADDLAKAELVRAELALGYYDTVLKWSGRSRKLSPQASSSLCR